MVIITGHEVSKQSGAAEACWAHNPEVRRSKLRSARRFWFSWRYQKTVIHSEGNLILSNQRHWEMKKNEKPKQKQEKKKEDGIRTQKKEKHATLWINSR